MCGSKKPFRGLGRVPHVGVVAWLALSSPFIDLVMANIRDVHANIINIPNSDGASFTTRIVNQRMLNIDPLEVNQPIANLIVFSEPSSSHSVGGTNNSFKEMNG